MYEPIAAFLQIGNVAYTIDGQVGGLYRDADGNTLMRVTANPDPETAPDPAVEAPIAYRVTRQGNDTVIASAHDAVRTIIHREGDRITVTAQNGGTMTPIATITDRGDHVDVVRPGPQGPITATLDHVDANHTRVDVPLPFGTEVSTVDVSRSQTVIQTGGSWIYVTPDGPRMSLALHSFGNASTDLVRHGSTWNMGGGSFFSADKDQVTQNQD